MVPSAPLPRRPLAQMLEELAAGAGGLAGQRAAAVTCALAASLVQRVARADDSPLGIARLARSSALSERILEVAARPGDDAGRADDDVPAGAAGTALAIAACAAQLTSLAAECAAGTSDLMVSEAIVAAELADGACRAAVHVVRIGLSDVPGDPRRTEATSLVSTSADALAQAFAEAAAHARAG